MPSGVYKRINGKKRKPLSLATKEKIRKAHLGKKLSKEHIEKVRQKNIGRKMSEEQKQKISEANKGEKGYWYGKKLSQAHIEKMREGQLGKKHDTGKRVSKRCLTCDIVFYIPQCRDLIKKYCSKKCYSLSMSESKRVRLKKECIVCKSSFEVIPYHKKRKICSVSCNRKYSKTPESRKLHSICQIGEKGNNWQGGKASITESARHNLHYRLWRESVFERDNYTCVECKQRGGVLNADHIKAFALYPNLRFAIDNGRTLCLPCHRKTETYGGKLSKKNYGKTT